MTFGRGTLKFQWYASYLLMYKKKTWFNHKSNLKKDRLELFSSTSEIHQINQDHEFPKKKVGASHYREVWFLIPKACATRGPVFCLGGSQGLSFLNVFFFVGVSYPPGKSQVFQRIWDLTVFDFSGGMPPSPSTWPVRKVQVKSLKHAQLKFWGSHREIPGYTRKHMGVPVFKNKSHSECKICWSNSNISPKMKKSDNLWNHHLASWTT